MGAEIAMFDVRYDIDTAGPSPNNNLRTELYFAGCNKALSAEGPCKGCFNPLLWYRERGLVKSPQEFLDCLNSHNIRKFITIVGGEPTDQLEGLIEFGKLAKADGYHIILFSWHSKEWLEEKMGDAVLCFDIIVPGEYRASERIYDENLKDGIHNVVGSGNQLIWIPAAEKWFSAADVSSLKLDANNILEVTLHERERIRIQQ